MPTVLRSPQRRLGALISFLLLTSVCLGLFVARRVSASEAKDAAALRATLASARLARSGQPNVAPAGPGGSQPWVRWNYIP